MYQYSILYYKFKCKRENHKNLKRKKNCLKKIILDWHNSKHHLKIKKIIKMELLYNQQKTGKIQIAGKKKIQIANVQGDSLTKEIQ